MSTWPTQILRHSQASWNHLLILSSILAKTRAVAHSWQAAAVSATLLPRVMASMRVWKVSATEQFLHSLRLGNFSFAFQLAGSTEEWRASLHPATLTMPVSQQGMERTTRSKRACSIVAMPSRSVWKSTVKRSRLHAALRLLPRHHHPLHLKPLPRKSFSRIACKPGWCTHEEVQLPDK